jgi:methionyl-tRNA formyltransferase
MITSVFMGTPEASVPALRALHEIADVRLVITRPDRPRGRRRRLQSPPIKDTALDLGLAVAQPDRSGDLAPLLRGLGPIDVGVVAAFGTILRPEALSIPHRGFLNVHFSLLPRWRGAAPVERALMAGDEVTGVTIMAMDAGLDTGGGVATRSVTIAPTETGGELTERLAEVGARLLTDCIGPWVRGEVSPVPQPKAGITYADKIRPEDRRLTVLLTPEELVNTVRALAPEPGAQLDIDGEPHKILAAETIRGAQKPGSWSTDNDHPTLGVRGGVVAITLIQPPGKRPMSGGAWLRGRRLPGT